MKKRNEKTDRELYLEFGRKSERSSTVQGLLKVARAELLSDYQLFDADPWSLNLQNGTLDLRSGEMHPHRAEDLLTKMAGCSYDENALCPRWESFLSRILADQPGLIRFVHKAVGYSLTGLTSEQCFFVMHGCGANGKSTFIEIITEMLGDYAKSIPRGLLMSQKNESHPTEKADLFGSRFAATTEVTAGAQWDEEKVKSLTGGDRIKARRMREDFWEFSPTHKLWISTNHEPVTKDNSEGFWRRVRMIPFTVTIPVEERDPHLLDTLRAELPGILSWAVRGCCLWQHEGLSIPHEVEEATAAYRNSQDVFGRFLNECCELDPRQGGKAFRVQATALHESYCAWAVRHREAALSQSVIAERMKERGFQVRKISVNFWIGLRLKEADARLLREENCHAGVAMELAS